MLLTLTGAICQTLVSTAGDPGFVGLSVGQLLNVPETSKCISETDIQKDRQTHEERERKRWGEGGGGGGEREREREREREKQICLFTHCDNTKTALLTQRQTEAHSSKHMHVSTDTDTHRHTQTQTSDRHTPTHMHVYANTHTNTHTHTKDLSSHISTDFMIHTLIDSKSKPVPGIPCQAQGIQHSLSKLPIPIRWFTVLQALWHFLPASDS